MSTSPFDKPPPENYPGEPYFPPESLTPEDKNWGMLAHLSALLAMLIGGMSFLGPLVVYLAKKENPFVEDQAKESLNFQISVLIVSLISIITCIGPLIVLVAAIIYTVIGAMEANKGIAYRYPYTFRLIK